MTKEQYEAARAAFEAAAKDPKFRVTETATPRIPDRPGRGAYFYLRLSWETSEAERARAERMGALAMLAELAEEHKAYLVAHHHESGYRCIEVAVSRTMTDEEEAEQFGAPQLAAQGI